MSVRDLFSRADRVVDQASTVELRKTVAAIVQDRRAILRLDPTDIAFLAIAHHWIGEEVATSLSYARLTELYAMALDHSRAFAQTGEVDISRAINRMIDQRVLIEQAGARLLDERRYALGPIGRAIANAYDVGQTLEAGRLTAFLFALQIELDGAIAEAECANREQRTLEMDRRWTIIDGLLADIDARRVNLDYRQEILRSQIPEMIGGDGWETALARCEDVLRRSHQAAEEVKTCLLEGRQRLQKRIDRLIELTRRSAPDIADLADDLDARLAMLADWASDRFGAWAGFHRQAMHFLSEMVRIDPKRTLARLLGEQIRAYSSLMAEEQDGGPAAYSLALCEAVPHRRIRPAERPELGSPIPISFDTPVEEQVVPREDDRILAQISRDLEDSLDRRGEADLHALLADFGDLPADALSPLVGRAIQLMLAHARADPVDAPPDLAPFALGLLGETLRVVRTEDARS